jgi:predicted RNase H-like nuclease
VARHSPPRGAISDSSPRKSTIEFAAVRIDAVEDPEQARIADHGLYLIEAFPALALPSIKPAFFGRLKGPRYNPARRKTFRLKDWRAAIAALRAEAGRFGFKDLVAWFDDLRLVGMPKKADQDCLDASVCLMIAIRWRLGAREASIVLGDLKTGYRPVESWSDF